MARLSGAGQWMAVDSVGGWQCGDVCLGRWESICSPWRVQKSSILGTTMTLLQFFVEKWLGTENMRGAPLPKCTNCTCKKKKHKVCCDQLVAIITKCCKYLSKPLSQNEAKAVKKLIMCNLFLLLVSTKYCIYFLKRLSH